MQWQTVQAAKAKRTSHWPRTYRKRGPYAKILRDFADDVAVSRKNAWMRFGAHQGSDRRPVRSSFDHARSGQSKLRPLYFALKEPGHGTVNVWLALEPTPNTVRPEILRAE